MRPSRPQAVRDRPRRARLLLTFALLMLGLAANFGPVPIALAGESPARDGAQVIAQGIVALPDPEVAWNVLSFSAGPLDANGTINADGQSLRRPGFLVAVEGPIITVSPDGTFLHRLNEGEAAFTPGDALVNPLSLTPTLLPFYGITLLPASGPDSSAGNSFFVGEAFAIEPSVRDLDLVRATLQPGETTSLDGGEFPALFLTTAGQLELVTPAGQSAVLATEQAVNYVGEITITNPGPEAATFVSAIIGDEATAVSTDAPPSPPSPPVADANFGSITVRAFACTPKQANEGVCQPITGGFEAQLNLPDGTALTLDTALPDGDAFRWDGLTVNPDDAQNLFVYTPSQTVSPPGHSEFDFFGDVSDVGTIALFASKPHAEFEIFNYVDPAAPAQTYGTFTIEVLVCPVPAVPGVPDPFACATLDSRTSPTIADLNLSISSGASLLLPDSTRVDSATWLNVPPGTYTINQNSSSFGIHSAQVRDQTMACCQAGAFAVSLATDQYDVRDTLFLFFDSPDQANAGIDSDLDGLSDDEEASLFLDPGNPDTDGDDLADGDEINYFGTNPTEPDTDFDAFTDGEELNAGTDPLDATSAPTTSLPQIDDPLTDISDSGETDEAGQDLSTLELQLPDDTGLIIIDTDADGFSDDDEFSAGSDPFDPASTPDSVQALNGEVDTNELVDSDFDGFTDEEELLVRSDPGDPASTP